MGEYSRRFYGVDHIAGAKASPRQVTVTGQARVVNGPAGPRPVTSPPSHQPVPPRVPVVPDFGVPYPFQLAPVAPAPGPQLGGLAIAVGGLLLWKFAPSVAKSYAKTYARQFAEVVGLTPRRRRRRTT